jgi:hypothetical protein
MPTGRQASQYSRYANPSLRLREPPMKITKLETFIVDGGWRAWTYIKV